MSFEYDIAKGSGRTYPLDRFNTSVDEAARLVETILPQLPELVIEPCAGEGAFVLALEEEAVDVLAYDWVPDPEAVCKTPIIQADFLLLQPSDIAAVRPSYSPSSTAVVGDPAVGDNGRLAVMYVRHALELANDVWMVLHPMFRRRSMVDEVGNGELVQVIDLGRTAYPSPVGNIVMSRALMHWHACDEQEAREHRRREEADAIGSLPFEFVSWESASPDDGNLFVIRRTGRDAGQASADTDVSQQANYLCRARGGFSPDDIIPWVNAAEFPEKEWSLGPRSLSESEMALRLAEHPLA